MKYFPGMLAGSALAIAGACAAASQGSSYGAAQQGDACWIVASEEPGKKRIEIFAAPGIEGDYALDVRQSGAGSSAMLSQSGAFGPDAGGAPLASIILADQAPRAAFSLASLFSGEAAGQGEPGSMVIAPAAGRYEVAVRIYDVRGPLVCELTHEEWR